MISFVWTPHQPLPAGTGGSENYTIGQVRELNRRGVAARVVTVGLGESDGRDEFPGIPFLALPDVGAVSELGNDDTVVFVTEFPPVAMRSPAYQILHVPPPLRAADQIRARAETRDRRLIATSRFSAQMWATFLDVDVATIAVVYPFAEPCFGTTPRPVTDGDAVRVLYAGRLSPEKGIYTLLAMLHSDLVEREVRLTFTATTAGADKPQGAIIGELVRVHPGIRLVSSRTTPESMAALMAEHDLVVMPSNGQYWHETFGIVSIEAQHAGCRVVASDDGGLPETDCGALTLVTPDDAEALAQGLCDALALPAPSPAARSHAAAQFTVAQSVDALLDALAQRWPETPDAVVRGLEELVRLPSPEPYRRSSRPRPLIEPTRTLPVENASSQSTTLPSRTTNVPRTQNCDS